MTPISFQNGNADDFMSSDVLITNITGEPRSWCVLEKFSHREMARWFLVAPSQLHSSQDIETTISKIDPKALLITIGQLQKRLLHHFVSINNQLKLDGRDPQVVIDISCMSRPLMAEIFELLFAIGKASKLTVRIIYALAKFTAPPAVLPANEDICPVSERFAGWPSNLAASTALVVGLGYEREKAEGACEYFDPSETWVFTPQSPIVEYDEAVFNNNMQLLDRAKHRERKIDYLVDNPERTFGELITVVSALLPKANPVILPFGPKVFFAVSLFVALLYDEVGIWIVTGDLAETEIDHEASEHLIAFEVTITPHL